MLAGIRVEKEIVIAPCFAEEVGHVCASVKLADGRVTVEWTRKDGRITLRINIEGGLEAKYNNTALRAGEHIFEFFKNPLA